MRQVQNVVRNIVVLNNAEVVDGAMLPAPLDSIAVAGARPEAAVEGVSKASTPLSEPAAAEGESAEPDQETGILPLWQVEKQAIEREIEPCPENIPKAAAHLGISASTIDSKWLSWESKEGS